MARFAHKAGLSPGTLVYTGPARSAPVQIHVMDYDAHHVTEKTVTVAECAQYKDKSTVTWINVTGVHDLEIVRALGATFELHPLLLEDITHTAQRPKMEEYGNYLYFVVRMLDLHEGAVRDEQLSIILGKNFLLMFQEDEGDIFDALRERIRNPAGRLRRAGNDYLTYCVVDAIVDHYFVLLEKLGDEVERLNAEFLTNPTPAHLVAMQRLKRNALLLRKAVWPLRDAVRSLEHLQSGVIKKATVPYLRDVYDHTVQVMDQVETLRDTLGTMLDLYLSSVSNRMNEIMKVLTIISTIFIPLTFIAGVYGMNFDPSVSAYNMPELRWAFGYEFVLLLMLSIALVMLLFFRRKGWI